MVMIQEPGNQEDQNCSDLLCRVDECVGGGISSCVDRRDERLDGRTCG